MHPHKVLADRELQLPEPVQRLLQGFEELAVARPQIGVRVQPRIGVLKSYSCIG